MRFAELPQRFFHTSGWIWFVICFCLAVLLTSSLFTGLAFVDAKELRREDIYKDNNDKLWIRKARHKIKKNKARCTSTIPLLEPAVKILSFYENHPKCEESGLCLPLYCNQTINVCLKEIAGVCNISKNLTTHVSRHRNMSSCLENSKLQEVFPLQVTI